MNFFILLIAKCCLMERLAKHHEVMRSIPHMHFLRDSELNEPDLSMSSRGGRLPARRGDLREANLHDLRSIPHSCCECGATKRIKP